ncbi:MAG: hypothetical protein GKS00_21890 [Alphaproteobacteria bacterium]|nr:hypothetical protein [Alphaproteobacteria bacterium]
MEYASPENPSRRYVIGKPGRQQMPNGDWVLTPLDVATAKKFGMKPVETEVPPLGGNEKLDGETVTVEADRIVVRREKRQRTADEQEAEVRGQRDLYAEIDALTAEVAGLKLKHA